MATIRASSFEYLRIKAKLPSMSKAFVREDTDDDGPDEVEAPDQLGSAKNYMTANGFKRMQQELIELKNQTRPELTKVIQWAAGNGDRSENGDYIYGKKRLHEIDKRMRYLAKRLDAAVVVDPKQVNSDQVLFGATVTVRDAEDRVRVFSIVGVDEIDLERGRVSWRSPLATALFKAREGDVVIFRSPKGVQELEVEKIEYLDLVE